MASIIQIQFIYLITSMPIVRPNTCTSYSIIFFSQFKLMSSTEKKNIDGNFEIVEIYDSTQITCSIVSLTNNNARKKISTKNKCFRLFQMNTGYRSTILEC